ncbi:transcriptional regulator [Thermobacillus composti KWC4]|jgi:AcrR family transcriptional regulator|uniref:Transcriptional regulator n=1 Tax=Thermobacillus composti (strain DSM 18247 / JCM 13945 / KWC4) TaxID=717605 RepID=L0EFA7_THECK|nr:TetR/AcrR family transcriptional regulator [Thermobacillus composti]AGA58963.1 transcriptional regulator [Thermobacillus composti KWC4]
MSPLSKERLKQIRGERREQIKNAALAAFARHGFAGTRTSMIAAEAGISEGLIYRYYRSKDELYTEIVGELLEAADAELQLLGQSPLPPFELIRTLTRNMLDENNRNAFRLVLQARRADRIPDGVRELLARYSEDALIDRLVPVYVRGQQSGQFADGDPRQLLAWYFTVINSLILQDPGKDAHGLPPADMLMRMLAGPS